MEYKETKKSWPWPGRQHKHNGKVATEAVPTTTGETTAGHSERDGDGSSSSNGSGGNRLAPEGDYQRKAFCLWSQVNGTRPVAKLGVNQYYFRLSLPENTWQGEKYKEQVRPLGLEVIDCLVVFVLLLGPQLPVLDTGAVYLRLRPLASSVRVATPTLLEMCMRQLQRRA
jgi:hypothetical protein